MLCYNKEKGGVAMKITYYKEFSYCLNRDMEFQVYGHSGIPIVVFPAQNGRFYDFENFGMVDTVADKIENGLIQLFCVDSTDEEHYSDENGDNAYRSYMLEQYYYYISNEIVPRVREINGTNQKIMTTGCSLGASHAANIMLRRPDIFMGCIALSGYYDSDLFFGNYVDEYIYNNSPLKYLNGMPHDHPYIKMYNDSQIIICCGQGAWEDEMIKSTHLMQETFERLNVHAWIDYWGYDVNHDWNWWQIQFPYFVGHIL